MRPADDIVKRMNNLRVTPRAEFDERVHGDIAEAIAELKRTPTAVPQPSLWRIIMQSPMTKIAATVMVVTAVLIGLNVFGDGGVAWGHVLENIKKSQAFAYRMKLNLVGLQEGRDTTEIQSEVRVSTDRGVRIVSYIGGKLSTQTYISIPEQVAITMIPAKKGYLRQTLTDELFERLGQEHGDPRTLVEKIMQYDYTELGHSTIAGIEVEGIESRDPRIAAGVLSGIAGQTVGNVVGRLWADVKTDEPVRLEIEVFSGDGKKVIDMVVYDYDWDIAIDPAEFEPAIPDDYRLLADVEVSVDEESVIVGLGFFAEYADGRYPSELSTMTLAQELRSALRAKFGGNLPWPPKPGDEKRAIALEMSIRFYSWLVMEDRDPAYHGNTVTAEFPHAVLMRWRTDDGNYKVVFGDLTMKEVTAEELADLEAAPLNLQSKAIKPQPADGEVGVPVEGLQLSWMPGVHAAGQRVYLGSSPDTQAMIAEVGESASAPAPALEHGVTYYWRVDEVRPDGSVVTGDVWSFSPGGLVGWWKFDERSGSTAVDASGHDLHGTLRGNPAWVDGAVGGALEFDGDGDYVDLGNDPSFDITGPITIAAWVKVNAFDKDWQAIVGKGDTAWRLQRNGGSNSVEFACTGLPVPGALVGSLFGTVGVNDGRWHHVAGTFDGARVCLYVDGRLDMAAEATGSIGINNANVFIGANAEKPGRHWSGRIDDVRVYSCALSAGEVAALASDVSASLPR